MDFASLLFKDRDQRVDLLRSALTAIKQSRHITRMISFWIVSQGEEGETLAREGSPATLFCNVM